LVVLVEKEESRRASKNRTAKAAARPEQMSKPKELTKPDLVLLSLLAERPMHGYQANAELERRCVRDWAAISRPQIYYSLEKLAKAGLIRGVESDEPAAGPERQKYQTTAAGRAALADALEEEAWTLERERPAFLVWMALSWQAKPGVAEKQLARRREYLEAQLAREKETLGTVLEEVGHEKHEAVWMITLMIEQFETELRWLLKVARELPKRGPARNPRYSGAGATRKAAKSPRRQVRPSP
jgi:DNA-binding PadR family transcriptional regulator